VFRTCFDAKNGQKLALFARFRGKLGLLVAFLARAQEGFYRLEPLLQGVYLLFQRPDALSGAFEGVGAP
jgi:hypothetical protein